MGVQVFCEDGQLDKQSARQFSADVTLTKSELPSLHSGQIAQDALSPNESSSTNSNNPI